MAEMRRQFQTGPSGYAIRVTPSGWFEVVESWHEVVNRNADEDAFEAVLSRHATRAEAARALDAAQARDGTRITRGQALGLTRR